MVKVATNGRSCRCQYAQMIDRANTAATVVLRLLILRRAGKLRKASSIFCGGNSIAVAITDMSAYMFVLPFLRQ